MRHFSTAILLLSFGLVAGCARQIPSTVRGDEYALYSYWLRQHYSKSAPENLYIEARTFKFDPLDVSGCNMARNPKSGVPLVLLKQLHALGDAEYRLKLDAPERTLDVPWKYKVADDWFSKTQMPDGARIVSFSRVAFDSSRSSAVFMFYVYCGPLCGHGNAVYAKKEGELWRFTNTGCFVES